MTPPGSPAATREKNARASSQSSRIPGLRGFVWVILGLERGKHGGEDLEPEVLLVT